MAKINPITENKHKELLSLLKPLIEFMDKKNYSYFFVAGKDGVCSRYMRGNVIDLTSMLVGMSENNEPVKRLINNTWEEIKTNAEGK